MQWGADDRDPATALSTSTWENAHLIALTVIIISFIAIFMGYNNRPLQMKMYYKCVFPDNRFIVIIFVYLDGER
ncbi:MAG: hypothetical protein ACLSG8_06575 [Barnesiella sp.]